MPPLNSVVSKKRMREISIQSIPQSDMERDGKQDVRQNAIQKEPTIDSRKPNVPLSRKQRRKQLRSVSKQSNTQVLESGQDTQARVPSQTSSRVPSITKLPEGEVSPELYTSEVSISTAFLNKFSPEHSEPKRSKPPRLESLGRTQTEAQLSPPTPATTTRSMFRNRLSSPAPLPQTVSYAAALAGNKNNQKSKNNAECIDGEKVEKITAHMGPLSQFGDYKQEESDSCPSPQEFKRRKRIRVRRRKSRQGVTESTNTSRDDEKTLADSASTTPADTGSSTEAYRGRQQSITFSIADTLVEEGNSSLEDDAGPSYAENSVLKGKRRKRKYLVGNNSPVTPRHSVQKKEEVARTTVVSEKHRSFIDTIREMLTYDGTKERRIPSPPPSQIISSIPQKYISPPKILSHEPANDLSSKLHEAVPEAGPQRAPLMPRSWKEARTWDMSPLAHGTKKVYTDPTQRQAEEERSSEPSRALTVQKYLPLPAPPFRTLWTVSRYLDLKQKMITEHRKEEGMRWAIMKAVEKNLDFQKRRESPLWPHNWNLPVEKDRAYMERMISRVNFLMMRPQ
ncbi:hypothetical protein BKA64DRAFT_646824 [Cadophora sp. MPI-SDFR-AT-0126]|nr:hypothetical protein BKA64DRAFT_646824 [Leotiomycetes sp. MPI-SDFR-AT-0126]